MTPPARRPDASLVIVGHGSTVHATSSRTTRQLADALRARDLFRDVVACFWMEEPALRDAFGVTAGADVYVVPNFISEGYFTRTVIPRELGLTGPRTVRDGRTIKYCPPTGSHPNMTNLLRGRAAAIAPDVPPTATSLVIVGHGTPRDRRSAEAVRRQVERLRATSDYAEIHPAFLEEPPLIAEWATYCSQPNVVVVPFFIADGMHSEEDIPDLIGLPRPGDPSGARAHLHGRDVFYSRAIGTDSSMAEIVLDQVAAFDAADS